MIGDSFDLWILLFKKMRESGCVCRSLSPTIPHSHIIVYFVCSVQQDFKIIQKFFKTLPVLHISNQQTKEL